MPKIIEDVKDNILKTTKEHLLTNGYSKLNLRSIASQCEISVGTIYNYFPSKDMLIASVMVEDWLFALDSMTKSCEKAVDIEEGFCGIYSALVSFSDIYNNIWACYPFNRSANANYSDHHKQLRNQLMDIMKDLLSRFDKNAEEDLLVFLAESLLTAVVQRDMDVTILVKIIYQWFK